MPVGLSQFPGNSNTYVRDLAASGNLVTQFSRNVEDFAINDYVQLRNVTKDRGYYLRLNAEQAGRLVGGRLDDYVWPDEADRPRRNNGTDSFRTAEYATERYDFDFTLGYKTRDQAEWNIQDVELDNHAQQAMTARTRRFHQVLEDPTNYEPGHIQDVVALDGNSGTWAQSTTGRLDVKRSINWGIELIRRKTLAKVKKKKDFKLVMNPETARALGTSQEMVNALIQSIEGKVHWEGKVKDYTEYGLPSHLYGLEICVEDTVMVTSRRGAATIQYEDVCETGVVYMLTRPGGLNAKAGSGGSYCSLMGFLYEDMTVEVRDDVNNRRVEGHVVDDCAEVMVAPITAVRFENVI